MTTLKGSTSDFPLESVIGLLAGTSKTGELQVRAHDQVGALGFADGRLVAAVMEDEGGDNALGAIFALGDASFEFTPWQSPPDANLEAGDLVSLLRRAADARDRLHAIRELIPHDRVRFKLSERAADHGAVTFTPERWRALLAVNGERDVTAVAAQLRAGRMETLTLLSGLVKDGVIETIDIAAESPRPRESQPEPEPAPPPARAPEPPPAPTFEAAPYEPTPSDMPQAAAEPTPPEPAQRVEEPAPPPAPPPAFEAMTPTPAPPPAPVPDRPARSDLIPEWGGRQKAPEQDEMRNDLDAQMAERFSSQPPPPAVDDRLSSLTGVFSAGPAANVPPAPPEPAAPPAEPKAENPWSAPPAHAPETWMTAPPAASEQPANTWAPSAPPPVAPAQATPPPAPAAPPTQATAPAAGSAEALAEKKKGGLFGMFKPKEPTPISEARSAAATAASRPGMLASFANGLLVEYNSGAYGKGKIETRMANLLMRVDEQADPIDRPLPIVDDLIDATALERESFPEEQAVPYLATLVRQIYEDAERAFGKDKAKKGYKTAQQQVFRTDASLLQSPELANKLPRV